MRSGARLTIDLAALVTNYRYMAGQCAPSVCAAAVKANAYGMGLSQVVVSLLGVGCDNFFVASLGEGIEARAVAGSSATIYVLEGPSPDALNEMVEHNLRPVLNSAEQVAMWKPHADLPVAIHLDTGMHRLGMSPQEFQAVDLGSLNVALLMSHLACGDERDNPNNHHQLQIMKLSFAAFPNIPMSIAHSAGILLGQEFHLDLCRPGIALYGCNPFSVGKNPMQSVVSLSGRVLQLRWAEADVPVGYGGSYTTSQKSLLATLALGYADGIPKTLGGRGVAFYKNQSCPIVGNVSMDLTMVDVSSVAAEIQTGDWLELLGKNMSVDQMADISGRFSYELLTHLNAKCERIYCEAESATLA